MIVDAYRTPVGMTMTILTFEDKIEDKSVFDDGDLWVDGFVDDDADW